MTAQGWAQKPGSTPSPGGWKKSRFLPKRPIRSFRDLEVYQRTAQAATEILTKIIPALGDGLCPPKDALMVSCLKIPQLIAEAHSRRFESGSDHNLLDEAMAQCNNAIVYLEQVRDIFGDRLDSVVCEDLIRRYLVSRRKLFNLFKAWKQFASYAKKAQ